MLILAGVAIGAITGDNGLIAKSKATVEESKKAEYQEGLDTIGLGVKLKTAKDHLSTAEYMDEYLEELNQEKTKEGSLFKESTIKRKNDETIRVETKEGYIYYVREDETIYVGKVRRSRRRKYSRTKKGRYNL